MPETKISHSPEIKELVAALAKAQGVMSPAVYNRVNPHFKNRYADFKSCMDACREPLSSNGLAPIQYVETKDGKLALITMLAHVSGQWIKSEFPLITAKMDSQGIGSAMTYAKRYSLCGMIGIVADEDGDDDGEASVGRNDKPKEEKKIIVSLKIIPSQINTLKNLESKLDKDRLKKCYDWLSANFKIEKIEDILIEKFPKALELFENAVATMNVKEGGNA